MERSVIFLDIDGVLNIFNKNKQDPYKFDKESLQNLKKLVDETHSSLVITSTWRMCHDYMWEYMMSELTQITTDIDETPIGKMDENKNFPTRGKEIKMWLNNHKEVNSFVILDDDCDMDDLHLHHILIQGDKGIVDQDVITALSILNIKQ